MRHDDEVARERDVAAAGRGATFPPPVPPNLPLFTDIGFTDTNFNAKPVLATWDALFARPRV